MVLFSDTVKTIEKKVVASIGMGDGLAVVEDGKVADAGLLDVGRGCRTARLQRRVPDRARARTGHSLPRVAVVTIASCFVVWLGSLEYERRGHRDWWSSQTALLWWPVQCFGSPGRCKLQ